MGCGGSKWGLKSAQNDSAQAAVRALKDALWRISLTAYRALDKDPSEMRVEIVIGVPEPSEVDQAAVLAVLPYGERSIRVVQGGLAIQVSDLPCNIRREEGKSLVLGGSSLVLSEGKACNPL